jgi:hypothetical protein
VFQLRGLKCQLTNPHSERFVTLLKHQVFAPLGYDAALIGSY